jgi:hypothetical protein
MTSLTYYLLIAACIIVIGIIIMLVIVSKRERRTNPKIAVQQMSNTNNTVKEMFTQGDNHMKWSRPREDLLAPSEIIHGRRDTNNELEEVVFEMVNLESEELPKGTDESRYKNYDLFNYYVIEPDGTSYHPNNDQLIMIATYIMMECTSNLYGVYKEGDKLFLYHRPDFRMLSKDSNATYKPPIMISFKEPYNTMNTTNPLHLIDTQLLEFAFQDSQDYKQPFRRVIEGQPWDYSYYTLITSASEYSYYYKVLQFQGDKMTIEECTKDETKVISDRVLSKYFNIFQVFECTGQLFLYDKKECKHIPIIFSKQQLDKTTVDNMLMIHKPFINMKYIKEAEFIEDAATILYLDHNYWTYKAIDRKINVDSMKLKVVNTKLYDKEEQIFAKTKCNYQK